MSKTAPARQYGRVTIVIDTSVVAKWFFDEPQSEAADQILEALKQEKLMLVAPDLLVYELANFLWKRVKSNKINQEQARGVMAKFERLTIEMTPADVLGNEALRIACDTGCTAYDGAFVVLAANLNCCLVTADKKFTNLLENHSYGDHILPLGEWSKCLSPRPLVGR